jgi:hypothetical protein
VGPHSVCGGATLLVIVLNTTPAHAAFLTVFTGMSAIAGRFFITLLIEPLGRRGAGTLACVMAALLTVSAGYLYDVFIGGWSLFYMLLIAAGFFSSAIYSVVGPYMAEIWPARLRSNGMGMSYGIGNLGGKVLGPAGLAVIMGAGDIIKPAAPNLVMLGPAFVYFASWYILGVIGFWASGPEKGRMFEEMGQHARPAGRRCETGGANRRQLSQRLHPVCAGESYSPPGANRNRKFVDSLLEGDGFEPSVPREVAFVPPRQPDASQGGSVSNVQPPGIKQLASSSDISTMRSSPIVICRPEKV